MCKLKSMIVLKDRIYCPDHDSHQQMLEELGIKDDYLGASKTFVRVEVSPDNDDITIPVDEWQINVDQDITPDWFDADEYRERIYETVKAWAAEHIHTSGVVEEISSGIHFVCGSATIKTVSRSATIEWVGDSATIKRVGGSATIKTVNRSATIEWVGDSATIKTVGGSATIEWVGDSATIEWVGDSSTIKRVGRSATIEWVGESATIEWVCGSATIEWVGGSATIVSSNIWSWSNINKVAIGDNATIVDRYNKTIYQAGDGWTFVKAEEEVTTTT